MKQNYKKGFEILMEYFDSISDEEKEEVDQRLKEVGLWKNIVIVQTAVVEIKIVQEKNF